MSSEERICPGCGGPITTAAGLVWGDTTGRLHAWAGICVACKERTGLPYTFGIDSATGELVRVEARLFDDPT
jgi:hypothetical protein